jgi:hypothetical protein
MNGNRERFLRGAEEKAPCDVKGIPGRFRQDVKDFAGTVGANFDGVDTVIAVKPPDAVLD